VQRGRSLRGRIKGGCVRGVDADGAESRGRIRGVRVRGVDTE
jgi:hypothetical protein